MGQVLASVGQAQTEELLSSCDKLPTEKELPSCIKTLGRRGPKNIGAQGKRRCMNLSIDPRQRI